MRIWHSHRAISSLSSTTFKPPSPLELNHLLQLCSNSKALHQGRQVHQQIIVHGLDHNPFMTTKLLQMYADCEDFKSAHLLFDELPHPNVFAWTAILAFYSRNGMSGECLGFYGEMKWRGVVADGYVFPKVLRACAQSGDLKMGTQVHKDVVTCGAELKVQVCNSLIDMYSKCGDVESARRVFGRMVERDLLSWNSMTSGYVCNGFFRLAVDLLGSMRLEGFEPDLVTWNTAMDAYCRMGQCDEAWKIFEQIEEPNIISWTTLISGYSCIGKHEVTLAIFRDMVSKGEVFPDLDCISSVIVSCRYLGDLIHGRGIHAYGIKIGTGFAFYKSAGPALLTMYARCRRIKDAVNVFSLMDESDVVTWNAMILSFADIGMKISALECFREMQSMGIQNDQTTISTVLPVCDLVSGKQFHAYISKSSFSLVIPVWNALIHMYSRCGCIETAYSVFSNMVSRDLVSWNTMIGGFGMNGFGQAAIQLLQEMNHLGLIPNSVTFTSVLSACSHSGLVDEGLEVFHKMSKDFTFNPQMEHFSCVVDLLARAGRLEEVIGFIKTMPIEPNKSIWGALLAASQAHQNITVAMLASEHLVHLEPEYAGHYVTLANIYASAGRWDDAVRVRKLMESRGLAKTSGNSWIESGN
ncbi:Pentatricopeptide repeat-containing protein [Actinidia chinensis var. chinensis]|uniref:Pentatricopeptide repeat-containing protein n=1 Tax=Actinidia chinensis var. chinensis TaxID=1590841 RepID=A0A2R6R5N5_ACTCC|nr:Pentatricopeptide repeat-containing protein [Actinidia chinensis var. chinensis]